MDVDWVGSYCGSPPVPALLAARWMFDPLLWGAVALLAAWLVHRQHERQRQLATGASAALFVLAFASPLCAAGVALFSARSVHHLWIFVMCAPLLAFGWPTTARMPRPGVAAALFALVIWAWHVPVIYDGTLRAPWLYWLMQLLLLAAATYWWRAMRSPSPLGERLLALGATALQMGVLGALLSFSTRPWFDSHLATSAAFGLSALDDQRLGGVVMWVLGMLPVGIAMAWIARGFASASASTTPGAGRLP